MHDLESHTFADDDIPADISRDADDESHTDRCGDARGDGDPITQHGHVLRGVDARLPDGGAADRTAVRGRSREGPVRCDGARCPGGPSHRVVVVHGKDRHRCGRGARGVRCRPEGVDR